MPSSTSGHEERARADVVLGDRYGTSCAPMVTDVIEETLRDLATRYCATSLMLAALLPSIMAIPPQDFMQFRLK